MRCRYIRKIFQNEENGYTIAVFSTQDTSVPLSARDKFWSAKKVIAFTAIGYDLPLSDEIEVEMEGNWESSTHGLQYKVESFLEVVPRTREGILGYLSCGSVKGVGPKMAERIVDQFGLNTLEIMEKTPEKLLKVPGDFKEKAGWHHGILWEEPGIPGIDDLFSSFSCDTQEGKYDPETISGPFDGDYPQTAVCPVSCQRLWLSYSGCDCKTMWSIAQ